MKFTSIVSSLAVLLAVSGYSFGAVIYSETFDTDQTANWTFASSIASDTATNNTGSEANVFFDYSTVGIPSAPNSGGTTRGMKMESNVIGTGVFSGMSMSPNGVSVTGDFIMTFDMWQNANGPFPGGGSGSTQMTMAGYGSNGTTVQFPGGPIQNSVYFGGTGEGGSGVDYRAYLGNGGFTGTAPTQTVAVGSTQPDTQKNPDGSPVFAAGAVAGSTNNSNAFYTPLFPAHGAPAAQTTLFSQQTGNTATGVLGMAWNSWKITRIGTRLTWQVNGNTLATIDTTMNPGFTYSGDNIFFGQFDINATSTNDANGRSLLFGLVDNIVVDSIPEPATGALLLLSLAGFGLVARRRYRVA
jgi:hypothetical protein